MGGGQGSYSSSEDDNKGFIDLKKLFDTINWKLLITTWKTNGLNWRQKNHYQTVQKPKNNG